MLNFAEQTGSGAVMLVWSFPLHGSKVGYTNKVINTYSLLKVIYGKPGFQSHIKDLTK